MPNESGDQSYYPASKVRLIIRFDEFGRRDLVKDKAPKKLAHKMRGTKSTRGALKVVPDPEAPPGVSRLLVAPESGAAPGGPQREDGSSDGLTWVLGGIVPKEAAWKRSGIRTASELHAVLKFVDCPFDPRCIRSVAVEYYLGTVGEADYYAALGGEVRSEADAGPGSAGIPLLALPDQWKDASGNVRSNLRFQGWVDEWEVEWPEDDEPVVTLTCRDNTKVLIDQDAPPKLVLSSEKPIDAAVAAYLSNFPQFAGLSVEYRPSGATVPKLGDALSKTAYRPKLGPAPSKGGGAESKLSVWDYLTDVAGAIGHVVRVDGTTVVVQRARSITSNDFGQRSDDPFVPRDTPDGLRIPRRLFLYGRNVKSYKVARKYSKGAPTNVEVRCYSTRRKRTLVVRYPLKGDSIVTDANPGDGHSEQKFLVWRVSGVEDEKTLRVVAQSVYETVGRNELSVSLKTYNLASFGAGNADPDLLDAKEGDAIDLLVVRDDDYSTMTGVERSMLVAESARRFLEAAGYGGGLADAYAKAYSDAGFQSTFRIRAMSVDWSIDDGVSIDVEGVNYVEVRMDRKLPPGEELDPADSAGQRTTKLEQPGTT